MDCREEEEYRVSHIPGALHLPFKVLSSSNPHPLANSLQASDTEVVEVLRREVGGAADTEVICYCSVGYRSSVLARYVSLHLPCYSPCSPLLPRRLAGLETDPPLALTPSNLEGSIFTWAAEGRQVASQYGRWKINISVLQLVGEGVHPFSRLWGTLALPRGLWRWPQAGGSEGGEGGEGG